MNMTRCFVPLFSMVMTFPLETHCRLLPILLTEPGIPSPEAAMTLASPSLERPLLMSLCSLRILLTAIYWTTVCSLCCLHLLTVDLGGQEPICMP